MKQYHFPFAAIIGQDAMKTALLLNAVDPSIGGVLIRGQKGTAKSTAVRALGALLPEITVVDGCPFHCPPNQPDGMHDGCLDRLQKGEALSAVKRPMPVVELPLATSEDRLLGSLQLAHALRTGEQRFEPGLLAAANRGILYVDEVNLLPDHLVDLLLDAAASGVNVVEREGIRYVHPARFILIGTMNPEEGELRPQFLDRFGLCVTVQGMTDLEERRNVVLRRLAFEQKPEVFIAQWQAAEQVLSEQVRLARELLPALDLAVESLDLAVKLAMAVDVHGHRADIAIMKTARALTALLEKPAISPAEVVEAARFVLPHRMANTPLETTDELMQRLEHAIARVLDDAPPSSAPFTPLDMDELDVWGDSMEVPGATAAGSMLFTFLKKKLQKVSLPPSNALI